MSAADLYRENVLAHNRAPRNHGALEGHTHASDGANPLCGDSLRIEVAVDEGRIAALRFSGESCAITIATASMLSERVAGLDAGGVAALYTAFDALLRGDPCDAGSLGELAAFGELARYPARRKCAQLPWATLIAALNGAERATTEGFRMNVAADTAVLTFRPAAVADVPAIVALVESAYRGDVSKQGWTTEADMLEGQRTDPEGVADLIARSYSRVVLALRGDELVCCCHVEKQGDAGYFGMFAVSPTLQGGGVGKAVLAEAERVARDEWGCTRMEMTVITIRDSLIAWYERRGYKRTGVKKPFPYGDERFGIPKRDDLEFEILAKELA